MPEPTKDKQIVFRVEAVTQARIQAMAEHMGLSLAEYCRLMCRTGWGHESSSPRLSTLSEALVALAEARTQIDIALVALGRLVEMTTPPPAAHPQEV